MNLLGYNDNVIDVEVKEGTRVKWRFSSFYSYLEVFNRYKSWALLRLLLAKSNLPWCVGGDFNDLLRQSGKRGRNHRPM